LTLHLLPITLKPLLHSITTNICSSSVRFNAYIVILSVHIDNHKIQKHAESPLVSNITKH